MTHTKVDQVADQQVLAVDIGGNHIKIMKDGYD